MAVKLRIETSLETAALEKFKKELLEQKKALASTADGAEAYVKAARKIDSQIRTIDKAMGNTTKATGGLKSMFGGFVITAGDVVNAAKSVGQFLWSTVQAAADAERAQARLQTAVKNSGTSWLGYGDSIEKAIRSSMNLSGIGDEELSDALSTIITKTGDATQSQKELQLAMDLSAAGFGDVGTTANIVAKILNGQYGQLKRLGIVIPEGTDKWDAFAAVQAKVAGQAEKAGNTTAGAIRKTATAWDELKEAIGGGLTQGGTLATEMSNIATLVNELSAGEADWYDNLRKRNAENLLTTFKIKTTAEVDALAARGAIDATTRAYMQQKLAADASADANRKVSDSNGVLVDSTNALTDAMKENRDAAYEEEDASIADARSHFRLSDAKKAMVKAIHDHGRKSREAKEATLDYRDAVLAAKRADDRLAETSGTTVKSIDAIGEAWRRADVKAAGYATRARRALSLKYASTGRNTGGYLARAGGGPVYGGQTYIVGEQGPELFTAPSTGRIVNARTTQQVTNNHAANITIPVSIGGRLIETIVVDTLNGVVRRSGGYSVGRA